MRKFRTTAVLLVILAVSIAGYIMVNNKQSTEVGNTIYKLEPGCIEEISILSDNGKIRFLKAGGKWEMEEPKKYRINEEYVNMLAKKLENLDALRVIESNADDLGRYGLDRPRMTVAFKPGGGKERVLLVGTETASKYQNYVKDSDSKAVYTITLTDAEVFRAGKASEFRDKNFLTVDAGRIKSFSLDKQGKRELKLFEYETGKWQFYEPCKVNAKNDAVKEVLKGIAELKIKEFACESPDDPDKYGLKNPMYTLFLEDGKGKTQRIFFGTPDVEEKEIFIKLDNDPEVYTVSSEVFNPEGIKVGDLLNETPLSIGIGKVKKIIINDDGRVMEFERDSSKPDDTFVWKGNTLNNEDFIALYVNMMALTADGYDDANKNSSPNLSITYVLMEDGASISMDLSKRDERSYFITIDKKPLPFYVSSQKVELVTRWIKRVTK